MVLPNRLITYEQKMFHRNQRDRKAYYVYIMASISRVLYIGVTNNISARVHQHKNPKYKTSFTARYRVNRLVYCEIFDNIYDALDREKQIKKWRRDKKLHLINMVNPSWKDLSLD